MMERAFVSACALVYSKQNETVECIKNCDKALEVDPKCVKALYRKALAFQEQNDVDEAIIEYKKVLVYEPDNKIEVNEDAGSRTM
ncbi:unnamed protein product [Onchocerca flexuosa]|uniref:TPR_REGION domain-containing protein n=1 Tax=Onchocerca flexuosa TaxID=387005 RepID=A0A183H6E8_9BILA|nr:unnamed protein product [Onchocerca flexuosa]